MNKQETILKILARDFPDQKFDVTVYGAKVIKVSYAHGPAKNRVRKSLEDQEGKYHVSIYRTIDKELYDMVFDAAKEEFKLHDITEESPEWSALGCKTEEALDATDLSIAPGKEIMIL